MNKAFIAKCSDINDVLVKAVFQDENEQIAAIFNKRGYHYKNNRQILIGFNTILTEIVYHKQKGNEDLANDFEELVHELHAELCEEKTA